MKVKKNMKTQNKQNQKMITKNIEMGKMTNDEKRTKVYNALEILAETGVQFSYGCENIYAVLNEGPLVNSLMIFPEEELRAGFSFCPKSKKPNSFEVMGCKNLSLSKGYLNKVLLKNEKGKRMAYYLYNYSPSFSSSDEMIKLPTPHKSSAPSMYV